MATTPLPIAFDCNLMDAFEQLDRRTPEIRLFLRSRNMAHPLWKDRLARWETHVNKYFDIEDALSTGAPAQRAGTRRLDKLNNLLNILDAKVGMLLTMNSLLLTAVGFFPSWLPSLMQPIECDHRLYTALSFFFYSSIGFVMLCCIFNVWNGFKAFRRVVWGDLTSPSIRLLGESERESEYVGFLIMSVARRTNRFRIGTYVTQMALMCLSTFAIAVGVFLFYRQGIYAALP